MAWQIDLNCDWGEGCNNEEHIAPYISSANIACGGHAGDDETIKQTVRIAKQFNIILGAHPSYPDRENFGRTVIDIKADELKQSIRAQIIRLNKIVLAEGLTLHHVKPHGALYNKAAIDPALANLIVSLILEIDKGLTLYGPPNSELQKQAALHHLKFVSEGFADRTYQEDGQLTPRNLEGALIENEADCIAQALKMVREKTVNSLSGKSIALPAQTICLHGDGKHAIEFAKSLYDTFALHQIKITNPKFG